jgi:peptidase MA superfamily protein
MRRFVLTATIAICASIASAVSPQERVSQTLDAMEQAVLSGDTGAYMAQIKSDDRYFTTEQRAWVNDLARNPVSEFRIEPLEDLIIGITGRAAMMQVRIYWMLQADGIERSLEINALFNPIGDEPDGPWLFAGRGWEIKLQSENGLRVRADRAHQELAASVMEVAPEIQQRIERELGCSLSRPLTIKIYPTVQELQYSIAPGYIDPLSGWNEPGESIKILGRESVSADRISSLLAHEIGHAVSFDFGQRVIEAPWWSLEGIAELVADHYRATPADKRVIGVAKQVARGDRRSWEQLSDFKGEAVNHSMYVYSQGWSMVRYITQRFGKKARNRWFTAMGSGMDIHEATERVLKISFEDLDRAWETEMMSIAQQAGDDSGDQSDDGTETSP